MNKKVSIVCITYNQEKYIAQAIESFLMQKTNFDVEIIISDDASSDSTPQIIEEYAKKNPNIKPILREKNIGAINNYIETLALATGEYVIVNEGDDYFLDENKLQKQVDFLDKNPDYTICFHPVLYKFEDEPHKKAIFPTEDMKRRIPEYSFETLLRENFMQTNTVMYRWNTVKDLGKIFPRNILPGDWYLHLLFANKGKIKCLEKTMSVYRINNRGLWLDSNNKSDKLYWKYAFPIMNFYKMVYINISNKNYYSLKTFCSYYQYIKNILKKNNDYKKLIHFIIKYGLLKYKYSLFDQIKMKYKLFNICRT